jgi:DNA-binding LytR/AlgR family response regulator
MKVLIVDDELRAREFLQLVLEKIPGVDVVGKAENGKQAIELIETGSPDLVFLDVRMPEMDGLTAAKVISTMALPPRIVFVTAYDQYAVEAFKVEALDYLVKPFNAEAVRETIKRYRQTVKQNKGLEERLEKVLDSLENAKSVKLPLSLEGGNTVLVDTRDINYIERRGLEVLVKTGKKIYTTNINLKEFEQKLDPKEFFRCHKGYIVRLDLIEEIVHSGRTFELILSTGERILLSREKEKQLRQIYGF